MVNPQSLEKYRFTKALRPFSFPVAIIACLVGIVAAYADGVWQPISVALILVAGVLLQAGVNLINDHTDLPLIVGSGSQQIAARKQISINFKVGMLCFILAAIIGLYLIIQTGTPLLAISVLGLLGALGYTVAPINYKNRGLGVVMVFWLMGVLMITGSYLASGASFDPKIIWLSIPVSCLVALLLLSNELRDYERDKQDGLKTLTVRMGYRFSSNLYLGLVIATLIFCFILKAIGYLNYVWPTLVILLLAIPPVKMLKASADRRQKITPLTARLLLGFGVVFCVLVLV